MFKVCILINIPHVKHNIATQLAHTLLCTYLSVIRLWTQAAQHRTPFQILTSQIFPILASIVPSDVPQNVTVQALSSTSAQLMWEPPPPDHINGIIEYYIISVTGVDTDEQLQQNINESPTTISGLHPFYKYKFSLAAYTVGPGPFSTPITLQMAEAGIYVYIAVLPHVLNFSSN